MDILISILGHKVQFNKKAPDGAFLLRSDLNQFQIILQMTSLNDFHHFFWHCFKL